ncbi:unnamed protein product [Sphagnum balticum]
MADEDFRTMMIWVARPTTKPQSPLLLYSVVSMGSPSCVMRSCVLASAIEVQVEGYELYLHLPELRRLWRTRLYPEVWPNERIVKPALHGLEMVFRMISSVLCDTRPYIDGDEWLRRLESLANMQLELLSCIVERDQEVPTIKPSSHVGAESSPHVVWHKSGSRAVVSRLSQESLLPRLAAWRTAQSVGARLQIAIESHMARAPFTLGLGEPNLTGKPILEYDKICTPLEIYACRQSALGHPEDHTLSTVHQIMEAWLEVAQGLLETVEEKVKASNSEAAAKTCWLVERVWKLLISNMDLLQIMDPDDFMQLKHELAINTSSQLGIDTSAYCLRSTMLRKVTKACKELRHLVPKVVGVEADPKGGPRLQEAVMDLFHSHGMCTHAVAPYSRQMAYHSSTIHLLQAFQAVEAAVRQFYFSYQQLVIAVMGSGEYKGSLQTEISAADALSQIYFEPPYFPSLDGAKTFLGNYWNHNPELEEGAIMKQLVVEKASMERTRNPSSIISSNSGGSNKDTDEDMASKESLGSLEKKQSVDGGMSYKHLHIYQGAMGA